MAVGYRDFPKFMAFIELINDPKAVKSMVKEMSDESRRLETAVKDLGFKTKLREGMDTYDGVMEATSKLNANAKAEAKSIVDVAEHLRKEHIAAMRNERAKLATEVSEMQVASKALDQSVNDHAVEYTKKDKSLTRRETTLTLAQDALTKDQTEWKRKLEIVKSAGV